MQCGGWSVTWQGSDTSNTDYPGADTIKAAIGRALASAGGRMVDGSDLTGPDRPDVAIVVYGEQPYAEMFGDLQFALYNVGAPLDQLRQLQRAGIRTVSVFLSGRPLWARPELDASDAFVAAWLPGTEGGGGIADVLIGDSKGAPRFDFSGRLSFAWPNGASLQQGALDGQRGEAWSQGFGLSYAPERE
jgi:beta-glucosidase